MKFISAVVSLALFSFSQAEHVRCIMTWVGLAEYYLSLGGRTDGNPFLGWSQDRRDNLCSSVSNASVFNVKFAVGGVPYGPDLQFESNSDPEDRIQTTNVVIKNGVVKERTIMRCMPRNHRPFYLGKGRDDFTHFLFVKINGNLILRGAVEINFSFAQARGDYPSIAEADGTAAILKKRNERFCNLPALEVMNYCASVQAVHRRNGHSYNLKISGAEGQYCRLQLIVGLTCSIKTVKCSLLDEDNIFTEYFITPHPLDENAIFLWRRHHDNYGTIVDHLTSHP